MAEEVTFPQLGQLEEVARKIQAEGSRTDRSTADLRSAASRAEQILRRVAASIDALEALLAAAKDASDPNRGRSDREADARLFATLRGGFSGALTAGSAALRFTKNPYVAGAALVVGAVGGAALGNESIDNRVAAGKIMFEGDQVREEAKEQQADVLRRLREDDRAWRRVKGGAR